MKRNTIKNLVAAISLGVATSVSADVKVALDTVPDLSQSGTYVWAHAFTNYLNAHGIQTEEYERGALGNESERLDQVSQGLLEVSMSDVKSAAQLDQTINGVFLPYFFKDLDQLYYALDEGGMLKTINEGTTPEGVRVLAVVQLGLPSGIFTTNKPVKTLADTHDLRLRALDEVQIALFEAWGSRGTVVAMEEVPNALQTGVADGYINPPFVPLIYGHTGFIKYFTNSKMMAASRVAIASEDWYESLTKEQQKIVDEAADAATNAMQAFLVKREGVLTELEDAGIEVIQLSDVAREEFRKASVGLYKNMPMPEGALDKWTQALGN